MSEGTVVNVPGVGAVNFPAGMSDGDIEDAIKTKIIPQHAGAEAGKDNRNWFENLIGSTAHGATFGLSDELGAAADATVPVVGRLLAKAGIVAVPPSSAEDWSSRYNENLAAARGQQAGFKAEHPYIDTAAQLAGNVRTAAKFLPGIGVGGDVLGNTARFAGTGAGLGGVQGFLEGEGSFNNRLANAGTGAAFGGAGGALFPLGGALVNSAIDRAGVPILNKLATMLGAAPEGAAKTLSAAAADGAQSGAFSKVGEGLRSAASALDEGTALRNIAQYLMRGKVAPGELSARAGELGNTPHTLADLSEPTLGAANAARLESPEVRNLANTVMGERAKQYSPILTDAFTQGAEIPSLYEAGKVLGTGPHDIGAHAREVGADLYGKMRANGLNTSPEMQAIIDKSPDVRNAIAQIEKDYAGAGEVPSPIDLMDKVKQKLNKTAEAKFNNGVAVDKNIVGNTADEFERAFWAANPAAEAASHGYRNANSLRDFADAGRRFAVEGNAPHQLEVSSEAIRDQLAEAARQGNQYAPGAYTLGVQNAGRSAAQSNPVAFAKKLTPEAEGIVSKLTQGLGERGRDRVLQAADAIRTFANTKNRLTGGSSTLPNAEDISVFNHARIGIGKGGKVFENIKERLGEALGKVEAPSERVTNRIGEKLLSIYPEENERTLKLLAQMLFSKSSANTAKASAASSIGTSAGGEH